MEDRAVAGAISGLIASSIQELYALIIKAIGLIDNCYGGFAFCLVTSGKVEGALALTVGILSNMAIGMLWGIVFAFLIKWTNSKRLILKGLFYGWILWMLLEGFGTVSNLREFTNLAPLSSLILLVGSILWGVTNAFCLKVFSQKTKLI